MKIIAGCHNVEPYFYGCKRNAHTVPGPWQGWSSDTFLLAMYFYNSSSPYQLRSLDIDLFEELNVSAGLFSSGELLNLGEADVIPFFNYYLFSRRNISTFLMEPFFLHLPSVILANVPVPNAADVTIFDCFQPVVWVVGFANYFFFAIVLAVLSRKHREPVKFLYEIHFYQRKTKLWLNRGVRVLALITMWSFIGDLILDSFKAKLANLLTPDLNGRPGFGNLVELADRVEEGEFKMEIWKGSGILHRLMELNPPYLGKLLKGHRFIELEHEAFQTVRENAYSFTLVDEMLGTFLARSNSTLKMIPTGLNIPAYFPLAIFPLSYNRKLFSAFKRAGHFMLESGILTKMLEEYFSIGMPRPIERPVFEPMTLSRSIVPFRLLGFGILIAFFCVFVELGLQKCSILPISK